MTLKTTVLLVEFMQRKNTKGTKISNIELVNEYYCSSSMNAHECTSVRVDARIMQRKSIKEKRYI